MGQLDAFAIALGDDVTKRTLKLYFAYRRIKNFLCVEVHPQNHELLMFVKVDPDTVPLEPGFSRDVRAIGHFGTVTLSSSELPQAGRGEHLEDDRAPLRQQPSRSRRLSARPRKPRGGFPTPTKTAPGVISGGRSTS